MRVAFRRAAEVAHPISRQEAEHVPLARRVAEVGTRGVYTGDHLTAALAAMAGLLAVFAAFERDILRERARAGLDHAKSLGKRFGRPPLPANISTDVRRLARDGTSKSEIPRRLGIGSYPSHPGPKEIVNSAD
jgi:DNA invertase Pin-like site-specific DNA recombinase